MIIENDTKIAPIFNTFSILKFLFFPKLKITVNLTRKIFKILEIQREVNQTVILDRLKIAWNRNWQTVTCHFNLLSVIKEIVPLGASKIFLYAFVIDEPSFLESIYKQISVVDFVFNSYI